ncbi:hypothetical protein [Nocardia spumae]|uniref:hypothetical protein n=1 Tax=Nocardia spumae TaxID=2887190 RepID=UPI001D1341A8|nr:hypothetical protein [Nocardia spumae]
MSEQPFTPALGRFAPTRLYDGVVALTRERVWRSLAVMYVAPRARVEPGARIIGVDPDPEVLAVARRKGESAVLRPGGKLVIADYGRQRTASMRAAFRVVQFADGRADTQPNAEGILPRLMAEAGFRDVREAEVVPTVTGSISVYVARRD